MRLFSAALLSLIATPVLAQTYAPSPADIAAQHQLTRLRLQTQADERAAMARANAAQARAAVIDLERTRTPLPDAVDARVYSDRLTAEEARVAAQASRDAQARRLQASRQMGQIDAWLDRAR